MRNIAIALLLVGCSTNPCSPRTASYMDESCAAAVVETLRQYCPGVDDVVACPEATIMLAACEAAIEAHAVECGR